MSILLKIRTFLEAELKLELSMEKTKITNCREEAGLFLGTHIKKGVHTTYRRSQGRLKRNVKNTRLTAPMGRITKKLRDGGFMADNEPSPKFL